MGSLRRALALLATSAISLGVTVVPQAFAAVEPLRPFVQCLPNSTVPCIESITVTLPNGNRVSAQPTGRLVPVKRAYAPDAVLEGNWQEWQAEGASFAEGKTNRFFAELFMFPYGARDCFYDPCVEGGEYVEFNLRPSDFDIGHLDPLHLPFAPSDYACGLKASPSLCYPPVNFGDGYRFELSVLIPTAFTGSVASGRGTRDLSVIPASEPASNGLRRVVVAGTPSAYWAYGFAGADLKEYGDLRVDSMQFWLWGARDLRVAQLGRCAGRPHLSVTANAFWVQMPKWNLATQSVDVVVQAPHYGADGSANIGMLQAEISKEMAACLWSVDVSKAIQAQIGVSYGESGQERVQTFTTKYEKGTYSITVTGMHFSSPTVSVKLSQATPVTSGKKLVSTIICSKGKSTRSVSAASPVCPKGWRRTK